MVRRRRQHPRAGKNKDKAVSRTVVSEKGLQLASRQTAAAPLCRLSAGSQQIQERGYFEQRGRALQPFQVELGGNLERQAGTLERQAGTLERETRN